MPGAGVGQIVQRAGSSRILTRLRALLRRHEFYLIPLALLIGVVTGAAVTLMTYVAQLAHVWIYGIEIDVRLSAHDAVNPVAALIAPAAGGLLLRRFAAFGFGSPTPLRTGSLALRLV